MPTLIFLQAVTPVEGRTHADYIEPIYAKGTSRRIYGKLYKVIDSSDVTLHIHDERDPTGTICQSVLEYIKEKAHKQVILVINKYNLIPNQVTVSCPPSYPIPSLLSSPLGLLHPTLLPYPATAFYAPPNHTFSKGTLIRLLRQFFWLHSDKKQTSVGFTGYPNIEKSSGINPSRV